VAWRDLNGRWDSAIVGPPLEHGELSRVKPARGDRASNSATCLPRPVRPNVSPS
jgi:hypothetical protein